MAKENTEWRDVVGYEGQYQVSDAGQVRSLKLAKKVLSPNLKSSGYLDICLSSSNSKKSHRIHRLVAIAFIPNPTGLPYVNHRNGVKDDNRLENLEWCTVSENTKHSYRILGQTPNKPWTGKFGKDSSRSVGVAQFSMDGKLVGKWDSMADAEREGYSKAHICNCCRGKIRSHKGFIWRYLTEIPHTTNQHELA